VKLLAIDPGGTTGLAFWTDEEAAEEARGVIAAWVLPLDKVMPFFKENIDSSFEVVVERFATSGRLSKYGLETIDLVGRIRGYCYAVDAVCTLQTPMSRRAFKMQGSERTQHEVDAKAHLLQLMHKKRIPITSYML